MNDDRAAAVSLDACDRRSQMHGNTDFTGYGEQLLDDFRVEAGKRVRSLVKNGRLRACSGGKVRKLERNVSTPDEN